MSESNETLAVGELPTPSDGESYVPPVLTRAVWFLWVASLGALLVYYWRGGPWDLQGVIVVDGLTVVMWVTITFVSGIVNSYARRYVAGNPSMDRFFANVFLFTLVVMLLVAADNAVLFVATWLLMGLAMAELIGHAERWPQARAAAGLCRRYFLASTAALAVALSLLWFVTGSTTVGGMVASVGPASPTILVAAGALLLAAMLQSALVPFHTWLLSSMTAPTPASALMHAGFVNAGGILLARFAPVVRLEAGFMLLVVGVGVFSALSGKLLKAVQPAVKGKLGCSTIGQMGFMIMQAGLGFFVAAVTHLVLHGFYKAYQFLRSGSRVAHESPDATERDAAPGPLGAVVMAGTAVAGGVVFATLTGKGTGFDAGLLLTVLVVVMMLQAARQFVARSSLPAGVRYGAVPVVGVAAIAIYAGVYTALLGFMSGLPAVSQPAELTVGHGLVGVAFAGAYVAVETGAYKRSRRLYVRLVNATEPHLATYTTSTEAYDEH